MRTKTVLVVFLLTVMSLVAVPQVLAQTYIGKTSQGLPMSLTTVGGSVIKNLNFNFLITCTFSGNVESVGMGFYGFDVPIEENGEFRFSFEVFYFTFGVKGTLLSQAAGGAVKTIWGGVTQLPRKGVQAELCTSGELWWLAAPDAVVSPIPPLSSSAGGVENDIEVSVTRDPRTGHVSVVLTR